MEKLEEYKNQDIFNPKFLFHGTSQKLDVIELRQSVDSNNSSNVDNAVFLTSSFVTATAYAFSRALKQINEYYSFSMNNKGNLPAMEFEVQTLPDDLYGYVYVFDKDEDMIKDREEKTTQYRCYHSLIPKSVIRVKYSDYKDYFERINVKKR